MKSTPSRCPSHHRRRQIQLDSLVQALRALGVTRVVTIYGNFSLDKYVERTLAYLRVSDLTMTNFQRFYQRLGSLQGARNRALKNGRNK